MDVLDSIMDGTTPSEEMLRIQRSATFDGIQSNYEALIELDDSNTLAPLERLMVALRVSYLHQSPLLHNWFTELLEEYEIPSKRILMATQGSSQEQRLALLLAHATLISLAPGEAGAEDIARLRSSGLSDREIVTLSQVIAFISYLSRVVAGLDAMRGNTTR